MTDRETALLHDCIAWMRAAAENVAVKRPDESLGLLRGAAKLEQVLTEETQSGRLVGQALFEKRPHDRPTDEKR